MNARSSLQRCSRRWAATRLVCFAWSCAACSYKGVPAYVMKNDVGVGAGSGGASAAKSAPQANSTGSTAGDQADGQAGSGGSASGSARDDTNLAGDAALGSGGMSGDAGSMMAPPATQSVAACQAHAGETVCDGMDLYHCVDMGGAASEDTCASAARCRAGITTGKCGICEPGNYRCSDATLQSCSPTGEWQMEKTCDTPQLCAQGLPKHSCDPKACDAGSFDCSNGMLRSCKPDLTDFDDGTSCAAELCDNKAGRCNECPPNSASCDATTAVTCSADGKKTTQACTGTKRLCQNGKCVECTSAADCTSSNSCRAAACNTGTGACGQGSALPSHTECTIALGNRPGRCDYVGNCVPCVDDTDCPASQQCNAVLGCQDRPPLQLQLPVLAGTFVVTVAPGYKVSIETPTDVPAGSTVTVSTGLFRTVCSFPNRTGRCTVAASTAAQNLTINGPSAQSCGNLFGVNAGLDLTLGFEDQTSDVAAASCDNPTLTLSAFH